MEALFTTDALIALLTLTFLEIILGIDNIVFLSIVSGKLKKEDQPKARRIGLLLAMAFRIILLFGITWVMSLNESILDFELGGFLSGNISGQSIIIFLGGLFLLYKSVSEIHHKLEGEEDSTQGKASNTLSSAIIQIALLNIVFSFDSILTAVGLVSSAPVPQGFGDGAIVIMILAVVISIIIMMVFAGPVSKFVNEHPTIQILGLSFLILIGVMLLAEGSHLANFRFFGADEEIHSIPKGYLYFSIFFSLFVEFLNLKMKKKSKNPVQLHNNTIVDKKLEDNDVTN